MPQRSASGRPIPDFAIVGAPRSGTTLMWRALGAHPQVFMSRVKEPQHFATDLDSGSDADQRAFTRDHSRYLSYFAGARPDQLTGEASAWHLYSTAAAANLQAANPRVRAIIQLRDPVQMLYSLHQRRIYSGSEDIMRFEDALAAEDDRRHGRRLPPEAHNLKAFFYSDVARLADQVERYLAQLGADAVHVIIAEELWAAPAAAYRATLEFLGVDADFVPELRPANAGATRRSQRLRRGLISPRLRSVARALLPPGVPGRIQRRLDRLNSRPSPRRPLDPALEARLRDGLRADVGRLGELIGRDLLALWWASPPAGH